MLRVHSYETFGTADGPGIRLVVFLQGCMFRCVYCHNPDTQPLCGGIAASVKDIMARVGAVKPYFGKSGGITASGGEPTLQARDLCALFKQAQKDGVHTALDTNGGLWNKDIENLYELTDLVILDVKAMDPDVHVALTGATNEQVLTCAQYREKQGKPLWLRYVMVPGYNDDDAALRTFGSFFKNYKSLERVELLPYHTLGAHKYAALGLRYKLEGVSPPSAASIARAQAVLKEYFDVVVVH